MSDLSIQIKILRRPEVLARLGIGNTLLHNKIHDGLMPPPLPLGGRAVGWLEHELDQVLAFMVAGKGKEELRALVAHLVAQRKCAA